MNSRPSALRRPIPFRDCGGYTRCGQQLDVCRRSRAALRRVGLSAQEVDSCSVRWRSGFPRMAGLLMLSSGCWVHDGFQKLSGLSDASTLTTRCRCRAAIEHRINNAFGAAPHLEWMIDLRKREPKRTQTQSTVGEDARTKIY